MPCCTPEVLLSEQSAIAEFPLSFCYLFVPISHRDLYLILELQTIHNDGQLLDTLSY